MTAPMRKPSIGRPRGATNKPPGARVWEPKVWKPVHEQMLLFEIMGKKQTEIADLVGRSTLNVSLVLGSKMAMKRRQEIVRDLNQVSIQSLEDKLSATTIKAVDRVYDLMHDDDKFEAAPFAFVDRAIKILQGAGKLRKESDAVRQNIDKAIILNIQHSAELIDGLAEAEEVRKLHG